MYELFNDFYGVFSDSTVVLSSLDKRSVYGKAALPIISVIRVILFNNHSKVVKSDFLSLKADLARSMYRVPQGCPVSRSSLRRA